MSKSDKLTVALTFLAIAAGFLVGGPVWGIAFLVLGVIYLAAFAFHEADGGPITLGDIDPIEAVPKDELAQELSRAYNKEIVDAIVGRPANSLSPATLPTRDWPGDWKELERRFRQYSNSGVYAEFLETSSGMKRWEIRCENRPADSFDCKSLCKLAGTLLAKSPGVSRSLSNELCSERDDVSRWLYFLKERNGLSNIITGVSTTKGEVADTSASGRIMYLPDLSARTCIECAADAF